MKIKQGERVLIAGKTGSGKTYLARLLLSNFNRLVVVDPNQTLDNWSVEVPTAGDWKKFSKGSNGRFRVIPPIMSDLSEWYDELFRRLFMIGNLTVYIDEAYAVVPPGSKPGAWLSALYTRGRQRGIGVWTATQRPTWIPLFMLSEAEWFLIFRLSLQADRHRLSQLVGETVFAPIPDKHGLYVYHIDQERPIYYSQAVANSPEL